MKNHLKFKHIYFNKGFTIIELISGLSIISILISITYPLLKRYFIQIERDSYLAKLNSFLELIKRETRRYSISCQLKTVEIKYFKSEGNGNTNDIKPFKLNCFGSEEIINNLKFEVPKISKNIFQLVSGDLTFTPKGQVFIKNQNKYRDSYVIVVGLKENTNGFTDSLRCLTLNHPNGVIDNGIYDIRYQTQSNKEVSGYGSFLSNIFCIKDN